MLYLLLQVLLRHERDGHPRRIGELRIQALRLRAESTLGPTFDLRAFHDELLAAGAIPLDVLEARIDRWIDTQNDGASPPPKEDE